MASVTYVNRLLLQVMMPLRVLLAGAASAWNTAFDFGTTFVSVTSLSLCAIATARASEREAFRRALEQVPTLFQIIFEQSLT